MWFFLFCVEYETRKGDGAMKGKRYYFKCFECELNRGKSYACQYCGTGFPTVRSKEQYERLTANRSFHSFHDYVKSFGSYQNYLRVWLKQYYISFPYIIKARRERRKSQKRRYKMEQARKQRMYKKYGYIAPNDANKK